MSYYGARPKTALESPPLMLALGTAGAGGGTAHRQREGQKAGRHQAVSHCDAKAPCQINGQVACHRTSAAREDSA